MSGHRLRRWPDIKQTMNYLIKSLYQFVTTGVRYGDFIKPLLQKGLSSILLILHVKKSTAIFFVYGELGRFSLAVDGHLTIIKYWLKIITRKTNPMVYNLYRYQYEKCELEHANNWASKVKEMLNNLSFNYAWINQNAHNTFSFFLIMQPTVEESIHFKVEYFYV